MPRPRKPEDQWMPPKVKRHPRGFVYCPDSRTTLKLCGRDATEAQVWEAYRKMIASEQERHTVTGLIYEFFESVDFQELSSSTQKDYEKNARNVLKVFGKMLPSKVEPKHVRQYMDLRGKKSKTQANREKAFFSRVFRWAYERGRVDRNPCKGVKQFKEQARDRYVTDEEYNAVYRHANDAVKVAMEISYLCAARKGDVLALRLHDIREGGLFIKQGKTGVKQVKLWTPRLLRAIELAKSIGKKGQVRSTYIVVQPNGSAYSPDGFSHAWRNARIKAEKELGHKLTFTFHDIKAKSISDFEGGVAEKQQFSGHKTQRQVATYDRSVKHVPSLGKD